MAPRRKATATAQHSLMAFGAQWCAPWPLLAPVLERLEADGIEVVRVDVDEDNVAAERHRIIALPTLLVMRGDQERRRIVGAVSEAELRAALKAPAR